MRGLMTVGLLCAAFACLQQVLAAEEPSAPAQYEFAYAVNDPVTGDQKDQRETRNGDDVIGYYRVVDPDGYLRTVKYRSDAVNGFTAEVIREPVTAGAAAIPASPAVVQKAIVPTRVATAPIVPYAGYQSYPYAGYQSYPYAGYQSYPYAGYQSYPYAGYQSYPYAGYASYPYAGYQSYPYSRTYPYSSQYPYNSQYPFRTPYVLRK